MNLLLDTHVALWAITDHPKLSQSARELILSPKSTVWVSVASVWEIAIKHSLGRGDMPVSSQDAVRYFIASGYRLLAIEPDSEVIVYCACPNEYTAAKLAKVLLQHGFKRVRPLLGGIDAWIEAGHPVEAPETTGARVVPLHVQKSPT